MKFLKHIFIGGLIVGVLAMSPITAFAALSTSLVSYWKLDESSGNAADSVGSNTLTNNNTATYSSGKINNGVNLAAASSQSLSIADASQSGLDIAGDMTVSAWYKPASTPAGQLALVSKWNSTAQKAYKLYYSGTNWVFILSDNGTGTDFVSIASSAFTAGTWYFITAQFTASTKKAEIFINGTSIGSATLAIGSIFNSNASFRFGNSDSDTDFFDGMIDEVGIWSRVLTGAEITSLYNAGSGCQHSFATCEGGTPSITSDFFWFE